MLAELGVAAERADTAASAVVCAFLDRGVIMAAVGAIGLELGWFGERAEARRPWSNVVKIRASAASTQAPSQRPPTSRRSPSRASTG
jgi:hypothetical protein